MTSHKPYLGPELPNLHLSFLSPHTRPWRLRDIQILKILNTKSVLKSTFGTKVGLFHAWYQNDPDGTRNDLRYDTGLDPIGGPTKEKCADFANPWWVQWTYYEPLKPRISSVNFIMHTYNPLRILFASSIQNSICVFTSYFVQSRRSKT